MFADITQPPNPLPAPQLREIRPGVSLLPPLSRRGHGPGLVVLTPTSENLLEIKDGVPSVLIKWAEEGYTVVQIDGSTFATVDSGNALSEALEAMRQCEQYDEGKIGLVGKASVSLSMMSINSSKHMPQNSGMPLRQACRISPILYQQLYTPMPMT